MKWVKVFAVFAALHVAAWTATHWYYSANPKQVLLVADTSYALQPYFVDMGQWISRYADSARYEEVTIGTDKALIGGIDEIKSIDSVFRAGFGRSTVNALRRYDQMPTDKRFFLTDGTFDAPSAWTQITFPN